MKTYAVLLVFAIVTVVTVFSLAYPFVTTTVERIHTHLIVK